MLETELDTLRREQSRTRQDFDALQLDWASTLNRIGQWASRQAAREQRATARSLEQANPVENPNISPSADGGMTRPHLSKSELRALVARRRTSGGQTA